MKLRLIVVSFFLLACSGFSKEFSIQTKEFLSPAQKNSDAHAPTIIETKEGLLVAWFGGIGSGKVDFPGFKEEVSIFLTSYEKGKWSQAEPIVTKEKTKCWNPVLVSQDDEIVLYYKVGDNPRCWYGASKRSKDQGKTWSEEELLPAGILGPIKTKALKLKDGSYLFPTSVEAGDTTACWIEILTPQKQWEKYGPIAIPHQPFGAIQPAIFQVTDGTFHLLCRDRAAKLGKEGFIYSATSKDGKLWSPLTKTSLPNPDSSIDTLFFEGVALLAYNPSHHTRAPLSLALNDGKSWKKLLDIEVERAEYPYMIVTKDKKIHLVYSYAGKEETRQIKHAVIRYE